MLRGDEVVYKADLSPYGLPHVLEDATAFVSYEDYIKGFKPKKTVTVGATCVAVLDGDAAVGIVQQIKRRGKGKSVWLLVGDKIRIIKLHKVIPVPAVHEFVRQLSTGIWFKVTEIGKFIGMSQIMVSPKKSGNSIIQTQYC